MKCCLQHLFHMRWAYMRKNSRHPYRPTDQRTDSQTRQQVITRRWLTTSGYRKRTDVNKFTLLHSHTDGWLIPVADNSVAVMYPSYSSQGSLRALYSTICTFNCHIWFAVFDDVLSRSGDATFCRLLRHCSMPPNIYIYTNVFAIRRCWNRHKPIYGLPTKRKWPNLFTSSNNCTSLLIFLDHSRVPSLF